MEGYLESFNVLRICDDSNDANTAKAPNSCLQEHEWRIFYLKAITKKEEEEGKKHTNTLCGRGRFFCRCVLVAIIYS